MLMHFSLSFKLKLLIRYSFPASTLLSHTDEHWEFNLQVSPSLQQSLSLSMPVASKVS